MLFLPFRNLLARLLPRAVAKRPAYSFADFRAKSITRVWRFVHSQRHAQNWAAGILIASLCFFSAVPAAHALTTVELKDLTTETCPPDAAYAENLTTSGSSQEATCYLIRGTAINKSGKEIVDADIFGRIYDADDNPVIKNRYRLGGIEYVPPGESSFSFRISVPSVQPAPLRLDQFKASGFASKVRRFQAWDRDIENP